MKEKIKDNDLITVDENVEEDNVLAENDMGTGSEAFRTPTRTNKGKARLIIACVFFSIALVVGIAAALFLGSVDNTLINGGIDNLGEAIGFIFVIVIAVTAAIAALITSVLSIIFSVVALKHSKIVALVFLITIGVLLILNAVLFIILLSSGNSSSTPTETQNGTAALINCLNWL